MLRRMSGAGLLALAACATTTTVAVVASAPIPQIAASIDVTAETLEALNSICGAEAKAEAVAVNLKISPGMGTGGFKVDTQSREAQDWFDFGLALSHAFYHEDAKVAMQRAMKADPACSLCAWGSAWTLGPTLNYPILPASKARALTQAKKALELVKPGDERARRLAEAMARRYEGGTEAEFGKTLAKIAEDYPDEPELAVLAAHSIMIPGRGRDAAARKQALGILEGVLKDHPDDTGAIHYYIHGTEFDGRAEDAILYADRLGKLAPAASHLVHMPAHTYFHAGRYHDAAVVNAKAIGADIAWLRAGGDKGIGVKGVAAGLPGYYAHNLTFGLFGALMSGDAQLALKYADHAALMYDGKDAMFAASTVSRTWVALARHAPGRALAIPEMKGDPRYGVYRAYARAEALLVRGDARGARAEAAAMAKVEGASGLTEAAVARDVLQGRIAMAAGDARAAAKLFEAAAKVQEGKLSSYMDPPSWWYPVRRSVAAAHLKAGEHAKAEAQAHKSLAYWKSDPLALWVLGQAQLAQGQLGAGEASMAAAKKLWRGDFTTITPEAI